MRLDQWLWTVRLYKTRTLAADAIKGGHVKVNGESVKPARDVRPGERITALTGTLLRTYEVIGIPPSRVGAPRVTEFARDLTPPSPPPQAGQPGFAPPLRRPRGAGRPTKRDRRILDQQFEV